MFCLQLLGVSTLLLVLSILVPGVLADYDVELSGVIGSAIAAFLLLMVIVVLLVLFLTWNSWFPSVQKSKGLKKMPRSYWKKKKESKERLLHNTSRASKKTTSSFVENSNVLNGNVTANTRVRDTAFLPATPLARNSPSWVQGWTVNHPQEPTYEEMALAMDLDEEKGEDEAVYRIETHTIEEKTTPTHKTAIIPINPNPDPRREAPHVAKINVKDYQPPSDKNEEEFRIVAEVVDDEELDLNPYSFIDPQRRSLKSREGGQARPVSTAEQTMTMDMGEEEAQPPARTTAYSEFLDLSKVAF